MRRRAAKSSTQFSLFPFLAVLLCTMGSLIVLLLVLVQQARVKAEEQTPKLPEAEVEIDLAAQEQRLHQLEEEREQLHEMAGKLNELRDELQDRLTDSRLQLSHLEDHVRRLRDELAQLEADYQVLKQSREQKTDTRQQQRAKLMELRQRIEVARAELDKAKQEAASKPRSFAIVPYDGPRGTRRRPIYLECRADQLIIHPEGNVLMPMDLQSGGAGNPLAAALRATREYLATSGSLGRGEPYPLLLVRPDGAETYAAARAAMESWSSEYGYELIDADMQLEFPPADEALGEVVRRSIKLARQRQLALAEARARNLGVRRRYGGGTGSALRPTGGAFLRPSRNGGFELQGGRRGQSDWLDSHVARPGQLGDSQTPPPRPTANGRPASNGQSDAGAHEGGFYATEQRGVDRQEESATGGVDREDSRAGGANGLAGTTAREGSVNQQRPGNDGARNDAPPDASAGSTTASGNFSATSAGQMAPLISGGEQANAGEQEAADSQGVAPIAGTRGSNWALPSSARGATPFRRPIRVRVHADKLMVLPDRGAPGQPKVTNINGSLRASIDRFVAQLWEHMNGWGIAGPQAYWKPILSVEVADGGERRYAELAALMQQSGVEVERKR